MSAFDIVLYTLFQMLTDVSIHIRRVVGYSIDDVMWNFVHSATDINAIHTLGKLVLLPQCVLAAPETVRNAAKP